MSSATLQGIGWSTNPDEYRTLAHGAAMDALRELTSGRGTKSYTGGAAALLGGGNAQTFTTENPSVWQSTGSHLAANILKNVLNTPDFATGQYGKPQMTQAVQDAIVAALGGDNNPNAWVQSGNTYVNPTLDIAKFDTLFNQWADANPDALNALYESSGQQAIQQRADRHSNSFAGGMGPKIVAGLAAAGAGGFLPSYGPSGSIGINFGGNLVGNTVGNALSAAGAGAGAAGGEAVTGNGNYLATAPKTAVTAQTNGATQAFTTTPFGGSIPVAGYTATGGATADMLNGTPGMEEVTVTAPRAPGVNIAPPALQDFQASLDELLSSMQAPTLNASSGIDWTKILSKVSKAASSLFGGGAAAAGGAAAGADMAGGLSLPSASAGALAPSSSAGTTIIGGTTDAELARLWGDQPGISPGMKPGSGVNALMQIQPRRM